MTNFYLYTWTACQDCTGFTFAYVIVNNSTNSSKEINIVIGDENANYIGSEKITVEAHSTGDILIDTNLPPDYTGMISCNGWYSGELEFHQTKNHTIQPYNNCVKPEQTQNLKVNCQSNNSVNLIWDEPYSQVGVFVYDIFRYKNNVWDTYFTTIYRQFTDDTIICGNQYSYEIMAVNKCLFSGDASERIIPTPYEEPCPTPTCSFALS